MKIKVHNPTDVIVNGKTKTLKAGEHEGLPEDVVKKLLKTRAGFEVKETTATAKAAKKTSDAA